MGYLFTSESVSEGHPDKIADQISDALLDEFLRQDKNSKVACETLVTTGLVVLSGEVKTSAWVDVQKVARQVIYDIGYNKTELQFSSDSCGVISAIHEQSPDINRGVERTRKEEQGAGDQGIMFGYACKETDNYMPLALDLSHKILHELSKMRKENKTIQYLRPDAKSQVTIEYDSNNEPKRIHTIVISTQHDEFNSEEVMLQTIRDDIQNILIPRVKKLLPQRIQKLFKNNYILHVNPTGKFVIGGPHGDTGLTGRKIIIDTYGGRGAHGGGAFSGKDSSKVDRSAAYAARHIAKNLVASGIANEVLIQLAYAIGVADPIGIFVNTYNTSNTAFSDTEIAQKLISLFDLRPHAIIEKYGLRYPIFRETAAYGHFGREYRKETVTLNYNRTETKKEIEFFAWEKLDYVDQLKKLFKLS